MRLVDLVFRQGHLSEHALIDAVMTGDRPAHLDRCDLCAERAVELGRWLDDVQTDRRPTRPTRVFTPERLAAQQAQILRRLEQLDEPARVIAFPRHVAARSAESAGRRVAAGVGGRGRRRGPRARRRSAGSGQRAAGRPARPGCRPSQAAPQVQPAVDAPAEAAGPIDASLLDMDLDSLNVPASAVMDAMTPRRHASRLESFGRVGPARYN